MTRDIGTTILKLGRHIVSKKSTKAEHVEETVNPDHEQLLKVLKLPK